MDDKKGPYASGFASPPPVSGKSREELREEFEERRKQVAKMRPVVDFSKETLARMASAHSPENE